MKKFLITKKITITELHEFEVEAKSAEDAGDLCRDFEGDDDSLISGAEMIIDSVIEQIEEIIETEDS